MCHQSPTPGVRFSLHLPSWRIFFKVTLTFSRACPLNHQVKYAALVLIYKDACAARVPLNNATGSLNLALTLHHLNLTEFSINPISPATCTTSLRGGSSENLDGMAHCKLCRQAPSDGMA